MCSILLYDHLMKLSNSKVISCPACSTAILLSSVPNGDLQSERGRRNAARRRTFGFGKGRRAVWHEHNPEAWRCRCSECLLQGAESVERRVESRIQAHLAVAAPSRSGRKRSASRARAFRDEIERAIAERRAVWSQVEASGSGAEAAGGGAG